MIPVCWWQDVKNPFANCLLVDRKLPSGSSVTWNIQQTLQCEMTNVQVLITISCRSEGVMVCSAGEFTPRGKSPSSAPILFLERICNWSYSTSELWSRFYLQFKSLIKLYTKLKWDMFLRTVQLVNLASVTECRGATSTVKIFSKLVHEPLYWQAAKLCARTSIPSFFNPLVALKNKNNIFVKKIFPHI